MIRARRLAGFLKKGPAGPFKTPFSRASILPANNKNTREHTALATLTIRNLPEELVERLKSAARENGRSMEQEVRTLLQRRYASRGQVLRRIRERWEGLPAVTPEEAERWRGKP